MLMRKKLTFIILCCLPLLAGAQNINFADANVKALCVANWDTDKDGELSLYEAATVKDLGTVFISNSNIKQFQELQYFTGLTSIDHNAFSGCSGLTSITIPESVTSIDYNAFTGCSGLTSITIPESVTSIGWGAFSRCSGLTSITIPNSVTSIGAEVFSRCSGLTSITIPESVTSIGMSAFSGCSGLTSITIPSSVTSIGYSAFSGCSSLTSITIPEGVTSIGESTFEFCSSLTSITIPEGVTSIGGSAFYHCSSLTSITIPASVTSIGESAFSGCSGLTSVTIPEGVTSIGERAFYGCSGLKNMIVRKITPPSIDSYAFDSFNLANTTLYVPAGSTSAYQSANYWKDFFKEIVGFIPFDDDNVKALCLANWDTNGDGLLIETEAETVTDLGEVFLRNTEITSFNELQYFTGLTSIGDGAFYYCIGLTSVTIPNSVTSIGASAFSGCSGLTSVTIPNSVTSIGDGAFSHCIGLTSVTIPNSVTNIGNYAFWECSGLTSVTIPNSVTSIGDNAFWGCSSLTSVTIPNSVTNIGNHAFWECSGLTSVTIPNSVTSIGDGAFMYCPCLTSVTIPNSVTNIGNYAFFACIGLTSVTIPNSVTSIGDYAFLNCIGLTSVTIPNSVTSIGDGAFYECIGLTSVTIPNSVTSIGDGAFYMCRGLTVVLSTIREPYAINTNCWYDVNTNDIPLYVPKGTKELYEATEGWSVFKNIIEKDNGFFVENAIYLNDTVARQGSTMTLSLKMKNTVPIRGFQFDLYLPEGVTVAKNSKGKILGALSADRLPEEDGHTLSLSEQSDGAIRFLCSSQYYDDLFTGNDGEIATLQVNIAEGMAEGDYPVQLKDIKLTESDIEKYYETDLLKSYLTVNSYVIGDVNSDKKVDVSDYTGVANHIHGNTPQNFFVYAADVDEDGIIDVSDYTGIANIIHTGSIYGISGSRATSAGPKRVNTDVSSNDNVIYVEPFAVTPGTQMTISFKMKNTAEIRGFQFDLYLPEGVTVVKSPKGRIQGALSASRLPEDDEHDLTFSEQADGAIRFLCSSQYPETFTGNDGEIATLQVTVAENMADGNYPVLMKNVKLTETDIRNYYVTEKVETTMSVLSTAEVKKGDVNGDTKVDAADVTALVNYILGRGTLANEAAAYVNDDEKIDIADVTALIGIVTEP